MLSLPVVDPRNSVGFSQLTNETKTRDFTIKIEYVKHIRRGDQTIQ